MFLRKNWCLLLLCTFIGFLPFYVWSFSSGEPIEIQKVRLALGFIEVLTAALYVDSLLNPQNFQRLWLIMRSLDRRILTALGLLILIMLISSAFGANFFKSVVGNRYRADGLITAFHLIWFSGLVALLYERKYEIWLWRSVGLSGLIVSCQAVFSAANWWLQTAGAGFGDWQGAQGGTFGQPQFLAGWLVVSLPVHWWLQKHETYPLKWLWKIALLLQLLGLVPTMTRAGLLGASVWGAITLMLAVPRIRAHIGKILLAAGVFTVGLVLVWLVWTYAHPPLNFYPESRARIFIRIIQSAAVHPLTGWGWANTDASFQNGSWPFIANHDVYVDKAHSVFFEYIATTGLVGLAAYCWLLFAIWQSISKHSSAPLLISMLVLYVIHSQTNIISIAEEMLFWMIVGLALRKLSTKTP